MSADTVSVNNLFTVIAQSFAIIFLGYVFGRFKIIPPSEGKAIGTLVGKLALPALLFRNLAVLELSEISWPFMAAMLIAKLLIFFAVGVVTVLVTRPFNIGKAAIFGIFASQSNDFALGLPIVKALYGDTGSGTFDYVSYIYVLAPISLVIINPIGFILMEYNKQVSKKKMTCKQAPHIVLRTLQGVFLNPIVFMTILGLLYNVIVHFGVHRHQHKPSSENLPAWLGGFFDTLGGAYAACALFQIGLFMVGKLQKLTGLAVVVAAMLIVAKTVLLPIIAYLLVYKLEPNGAMNTTRDDISTFGFLLGTFPTAPTVFVFASQYKLAMEIIASSIVLCTFMSAPIMYVSARMVLVHYTSQDEYSHIIETTRRDVTIIAVCCVVWVTLLFIFSKRYRSYAHVFVMHLMVAMFLEVVGGELLNHMAALHEIYWELFWFSIFFIGVLGTRTWMASLSIGLALLYTVGPRKANKAWLPLLLLSWGIPILITVILMAVVSANIPKNNHLVDISFLLGKGQLYISLVVLVSSFIVTLVCVFLVIARSRRAVKKRQKAKNGSQYENTLVLENSTQSSVTKRNTSSQAKNDTPMVVNYGADSLSSHMSQKDSNSLFLTIGASNSPVRYAPDFRSREDQPPQENTPLLSHDRSPTPELESTLVGLGTMPTTGVWDKDTSGRHLIRFIVLLMFLLFSSLVGILIVFWQIISSSKNSGIYIAVNVLDTVTNFGQGFFVFAAFGFEKYWFWVFIYNKIRRLLFRIETVTLPLEDEVEAAVKTLCSSFKASHMAACKEDIVSDKKYYLRVFESVFTGADFVDWLVQRHIVKGREEAVEYGHSLMIGRVLAHVTEEHYFHDEPYFYRFV